MQDTVAAFLTRCDASRAIDRSLVAVLIEFIGAFHRRL